MAARYPRGLGGRVGAGGVLAPAGVREASAAAVAAGAVTERPTNETSRERARETPPVHAEDRWRRRATRGLVTQIPSGRPAPCWAGCGDRIGLFAASRCHWPQQAAAVAAGRCGRAVPQA